MNAFGIRLAKAKFSEIVRAAAGGERSLVTDNRKVVAMIGPPPSAPAPTQASSPSAEKARPLSDARAFREALFAAPHPLDLEF
jgi:antitoxin (DNA-binding transcriptional repressor) of toxin-antitoxin stability system